MKHIISAKYKCFVLFVETFLVILLLPVFYNYIPIAKNAPATFYIPSSNIDDVVYTLEKYGYMVTFIDKLMLQLINTPEKGWYHVDHNEHGRLLFFATIHNKKTETMDIIVYAGETAEELVTRLSKDMKLDRVKLQEKYKLLTRFQEADIFAKRYSIARKANEEVTIQYLFDMSNAQLSKFTKENFTQTPDTATLKVLLTIASIIQKESNSVKEMPLISSVIHNRLNKGMKLQMDSTLNYGEHSHRIITSERIKSDKSYYNTYKHKGLPPHPLGTVTLNALKAAMSPQKSNYLFFMLNKKGEHDFAAKYGKHLENLKAYRFHQKKRALRKAKQANKIEQNKKSGQVKKAKAEPKKKVEKKTQAVKQKQIKKQENTKKEKSTKLKKDTNKTREINTSK